MLKGESSLKRLLHAGIVLDDQDSAETHRGRDVVLNLSYQIRGIDHIRGPLHHDCPRFKSNSVRNLAEITFRWQLDLGRVESDPVPSVAQDGCNPGKAACFAVRDIVHLAREIPRSSREHPG